MLRALRREEGQGLVEYALIMVMIVVVLIAALTFFGGSLTKLYGDIAGAFGAM